MSAQPADSVPGQAGAFFRWRFDPKEYGARFVFDATQAYTFIWTIAPSYKSSHAYVVSHSSRCHSSDAQSLASMAARWSMGREVHRGFGVSATLASYIVNTSYGITNESTDVLYTGGHVVSI